jgi:hypothetical protein
MAMVIGSRKARLGKQEATVANARFNLCGFQQRQRDR